MSSNGLSNKEYMFNYLIKNLIILSYTYYGYTTDNYKVDFRKPRPNKRMESSFTRFTTWGIELGTSLFIGFSLPGLYRYITGKTIQ